MDKTVGATVYFRTFRRDEYTALSSPPAAQVENHLLWGRGALGVLLIGGVEIFRTLEVCCLGLSVKPSRT